METSFLKELGRTTYSAKETWEDQGMDGVIDEAERG
jgi:hypothetical protein